MLQASFFVDVYAILLVQLLAWVCLCYNIVCIHLYCLFVPRSHWFVDLCICQTLVPINVSYMKINRYKGVYLTIQKLCHNYQIMYQSMLAYKLPSFHVCYFISSATGLGNGYVFVIILRVFILYCLLTPLSHWFVNFCICQTLFPEKSFIYKDNIS